MPTVDLSLICAPMVNQSDLPFRLLVRKHGAKLAYTQMFDPSRLLHEDDYFTSIRRDLTLAQDDVDARPVALQLGGNDVETIVNAARKVSSWCDAIEHAREGRYGAYLLGQKDWPLIEQIISSLNRSLSIPVAAKIRLCQPASLTPLLATRLGHAGASWITLHARHVSARRRRAGPADISVVKALKQELLLREMGEVRVVSNGNVRTWEDVVNNREETGADGIMVGESLLGNPYLFQDTIPDALDLSLEYLQLCNSYPETASIETIRTHIRHFVEKQYSRTSWYTAFRSSLGHCATVDDVESLIDKRVRRWRTTKSRGKSGKPRVWESKGHGQEEDEDENFQIPEGGTA